MGKNEDKYKNYGRNKNKNYSVFYHKQTSEFQRRLKSQNQNFGKWKIFLTCLKNFILIIYFGIKVPTLNRIFLLSISYIDIYWKIDPMLKKMSNLSSLVPKMEVMVTCAFVIVQYSKILRGKLSSIFLKRN